MRTDRSTRGRPGLGSASCTGTPKPTTRPRGRWPSSASSAWPCRPRSTARSNPRNWRRSPGSTVTPAGHRRRRGAAAVAGRPRARPACPSITRGTCRSSRAPRPRPPRASTCSSARPACTAGRGWRARARSTSRTRRCAGSPTWPGCRPRRAASSSRAARSATSPRWSPPARTRCCGRAGRRPDRWAVCVTGETHSSVKHALRVVMDADVVEVPGDERGRMTGAGAAPDGRATSAPASATAIFAVVATGGHDQPRRRRRHRRHRRRRRRARAGGCTSTARTAAPGWPRRACATCIDGVERADSFIVDPHKWFFAPFDSCALIYRDPSLAPRRAHPARRATSSR